MPAGRRLLLLAAAAGAATTLTTPAPAVAAPLPFPPPSFAPHGADDPAAAADTEAVHGPLADMLAGVLLVREGGVKEAVAALPGLHDMAKAYVLALEALKDGPKARLEEEWGGLTPSQAASLMKHKAGDAWAQTGIDDAKKAANLAGQAMNLLPAALGPDKEAWAGLTPEQAAALVKGEAGAAWNDTAARYRSKVGNLTDPLWEAGVRLEAKLGGPHTKNKTDAWVEKLAAKMPAKDKANDTWAAEVEAKLEAFNIHITDKVVEKPSKFRNMAALVIKHISGAMLFDYAVDFNPCLISIMPSAAHLQATAINFNPAVFEAMPTGVMAMAQGLNVQPALIMVMPMGVNVQPQGAQVAPFLIAVSPMGANIQPQGSVVAPAGTSIMPTGKLVAPQGSVYAPTKVMYMPVGTDTTPGGSGRHHGGHGGDGGDGVGGGL